jgi:hypothetical protein
MNNKTKYPEHKYFSKQANILFDLLFKIYKQEKRESSLTYTYIIKSIDKFDEIIFQYYKKHIRKQYGEVDLNSQEKVVKYLENCDDSVFKLLMVFKDQFNNDPKLKDNLKAYIGIIYNEKFKKCKDCKFCKTKDADNDQYICTKFFEKVVMDDNIHGIYDVVPINTTTCEFARDAESMCGIEAKLFKKANLFNKIKRTKSKKVLLLCVMLSLSVMVITSLVELENIKTTNSLESSEQYSTQFTVDKIEKKEKYNETIF